MEILSLSLNHRVTPLQVRERIVFNQEEGEEFLQQVQGLDQIGEAMLISTCNRTELYTLVEQGSEMNHDRFLVDLLSRKRGFVARENPSNYVLFRNEEAVRHLFRVTGGLDSQILGESQILGQVKDALVWGQAAGTSGRVLHRLWERALRVGKRVRSETGIGEGTLSASHAALELARKVFGHLRGKHVLVIGTGEIGTLTLESLKGVPLAGLTIMNRTLKYAEEMAERFHGEARDFGELAAAVVAADLVISSTSSKEPLLSYQEMKSIRRRRGGHRPLVIIDLALPRDFDERCGSLDEVFLKNLEDLDEIVQSNLSDRQSELPRAESIVEAELANFYKWVNALEVEPTIRELRKLFHAIREEEMEELRRSLDEETFQRVNELNRRLVNRLLHRLSKNLRRYTGVRDPRLVSDIHELLTKEIPHEED